MANQPKPANLLQAFAGSRPNGDVMTRHASSGCCGDSAFDTDRLGQVIRFDNALAHMNPDSGRETWRITGNGFAVDRDTVINHINNVGVGARVSTHVIPTFATLRVIHIHIDATEPEFNAVLKFRNKPAAISSGVRGLIIDTTASGCTVNRVFSSDTVIDTFTNGFLTKPANAICRDIIIMYSTQNMDETTFNKDGEELYFEVIAMPTGGKINGTVNFDVTVAYDVHRRAEL